MVLHNSLFRSGTIYDVPDIIGLIERRIEWMDCNGINQWNKSHYRERYPDGYYRLFRDVCLSRNHEKLGP